MQTQVSTNKQTGRPFTSGITAPYASKEYYKQFYQIHKGEYSLASNARQLKKKLFMFGLTEDEYNKLLAQGCKVCGTKSEGRRLHLDHNHLTGEFRGMLCTNCNTALGLCGDNPERLIKLADYLANFAINVNK